MASSENSSQSGSRTRVIVGLDIGTTFSGISYAVLTQNPDRPTSFWWEVDGKKSQKIPTKIEVSETPIEWFKLSLLHRNDLPSDISKLQPGHVVIVCDCGGGSIDTGAYEICSVHPFRVKEVLPGQCILAGACILDDAFMQLLKDKVETMNSPRAFQALTEKDLHGIVYNHWELDIKGCFNDNFPTKHIYLPIKWAASRHKRMPVGQGDDITFTHGDLASIFNPIVGKITSLIEMEMQKISSSLSKDVSVSEMPAKPVLSDAHSHEDHQHLIVAGGFGQNGYLRQKIVQTVNRVSPTTNILDYPDGQGIVRASWGVRASHGNSIFWLVHENESLDATSPNLRPIPVEALSAEDPASSDVFSIRVCRTQQNAGQYYQDVCRLSWKTVDVGLKSDMNADLKAHLQIEFIWDGAEMGFWLIYGGVQQSSVKVEHSWEF
ncbi:hypothetical protein QWA68_007355 [Fusarium oxysporum]|nr:hypothetical protein QWA68_007355 [Fusarium oxysporum]